MMQLAELDVPGELQALFLRFTKTGALNVGMHIRQQEIVNEFDLHFQGLPSIRISTHALEIWLYPTNMDF